MPTCGSSWFQGKIPYSAWNVFISILSFISSPLYIWEISVQIWIQFQRRSERPLHSLQYDHSTWKNENGRNQIPSMPSLPWLLKTCNSFGCLPLWTTWPELLSWNHQCHTMFRQVHFYKRKNLDPPKSTYRSLWTTSYVKSVRPNCAALIFRATPPFQNARHPSSLMTIYKMCNRKWSEKTICK